MGACPCFAGFKGHRNPNHRRFEFEPGRLGIRHDDGIVTDVDEGQAKDAGVKEGWKMVSFDGQPFSEKVLVQAVGGSSSYVLTFDIRGRDATKNQAEAESPKAPLTKSPSPLAEAPGRKPIEKQKPAHEVDDSDSEDANHRSFSFQSGSLGICHDDGVVSEVKDGQAKDVGVKVGWTMIKCAGKPYSEDNLERAVEGSTSYVVTFDTRIAEVSSVSRKESTESVGSSQSQSKASYVGWSFRRRQRANSALKGANGRSSKGKKVRFSI